MAEEVRVQIEEPEDAEGAEAPPLSRRLRDFTLNRIAGVLTPIVEHVNQAHLQPILWINNNNAAENNALPANVNVTISDQPDNTFSINLGPLREAADSEETPLLPQANSHAIDINTNVVRNDGDNNNQNRVVDLNFNEYIPIISKCAIFIFILAIKFLYNHLEGVITFVFMQALFNFLGDEQINFRNKNILKFLLNTLLIVKCLDYIYQYEGLPLTLVVYNLDFIFPTNVWDVLWIVYMNDCFLQFSTMLLKMPVKCFPLKYMTIRTKLKIYSMLEAISQLYRNIIPIQPWLCYFYELSRVSSFPQLSYIIGIVLSVAYSILKCSDVVRKLAFVKSTVQKVFKRSGLVSLNKEQLASKELKCSICLEDFNFPLQLNCSHIFCSTCITQWSVKNKTCPLCRTPMNEDFAFENISSTVFLQLF